MKYLKNEESRRRERIQFSIVITTYKRPDLVLRAIKSISAQSYTDWQIVLVNDSPHDNYIELEKFISAIHTITYIKNKENFGKNSSVNTAFAYLKQTNFDGYVVFLDDDDWLSPDCLENFMEAINEKNFPTWIVSTRANTKNISFTKNKTGRNMVYYYRDCLIGKRFTGDATHCISFAETNHCRFSESVKNGEEWMYFAQIAKYSPAFSYLSRTGTYSEGYLEDGLTQSPITRKQRLKLYRALSKELVTKQLLNLPIFIYMILRLGKIFL